MKTNQRTRTTSARNHEKRTSLKRTERKLVDAALWWCLLITIDRKIPINRTAFHPDGIYSFFFFLSFFTLDFSFERIRNGQVARHWHCTKRRQIERKEGQRGTGTAGRDARCGIRQSAFDDENAGGWETDGDRSRSNERFKRNDRLNNWQRGFCEKRRLPHGRHLI